MFAPLVIKAIDQTWAADQPQVEEALGALHEEIAVLRMSATTLATAADQVYRAAAAVVANVRDAAGLQQADQDQQTAVTQLWRTAHGEMDS